MKFESTENHVGKAKKKNSVVKLFGKIFFLLQGGSFLKKSGLFILFLILAGFSVNAEEAAGEVGDGNGHFFSLGLSFGMLSGANEEIIYYSSSANNYKSQLIWQLNPLFYAGVDADYSWRSPANPKNIFQSIFSGFFVGASFKYGLPADTGFMEDRDWLWASIPGWLTNYSFHTNRTNTAMLGGLDIGKSFWLYNKFRLNVFLSYNVMYYSFAANGGTWLYPLDSYGFYDPGSDNVITYRQFWQILSPGLSFYGVFNSYFDIEIFAKATPLIAAASLDEHLRTPPPSQIIIDPMFFGLYIEPGFVFTLKPPASKLMLSLSLNYRNINGTRGNYRRREESPDGSYIIKQYGYTGGAGYSAFDIGIAAKIRIGK